MGLGISVVAGLTISVFTYFYYLWIDHETLSYLTEQTQKYLVDAKKSQSEIDMEMQALKDFYAPFHQATGVLTGILIAGVIFSVVASTFLLRRNPNAN